jgi:hypothetical protein
MSLLGGPLQGYGCTMKLFCILLVGTAWALGGCSGRGGKAVDGASDLRQREGAGSDVGYAEGDQYRDGPYLCCAKNSGNECCAGEKQGFCFEYGGIYQACRTEGEEYEGKVTCAHCCEGLGAAQSADVTSLEGEALKCSVPPVSLLRCVHCGDGTCGLGENRCNCPQDCGT